jgi:hypothetical protein
MDKIAIIDEQLELVENIKNTLTLIAEKTPLTPKIINSFFTKLEGTLKDKLKINIQDILNNE